MKTQLFTLALGFVCFFSLSSMASEKSASEKNADNISVSTLASTIETPALDETLSIEAWMINEDLWKTTVVTTENYEEAVNEEELQVEDWMTDPEVWNKDYETSTVYISGGKAYLIIHPFRVPKVKDQPLAVERWMINDYLWRM